MLTVFVACNVSDIIMDVDIVVLYWVVLCYLTTVIVCVCCVLYECNQKNMYYCSLQVFF